MINAFFLLCFPYFYPPKNLPKYHTNVSKTRPNTSQKYTQTPQKMPPNTPPKQISNIKKWYV